MEPTQPGLPRLSEAVTACSDEDRKGVCCP
jgi:hypothetical protein